MKKQNNTPSNKYWVVGKYLLIILASGALGAMFSMGVLTLQNGSDAWGDKLAASLAGIILPLQLAVFLLLSAVSVTLYLLGRRCVKRVEKNREDELSSQRGDLLLGWGMTLCSAEMILIYGLFGLSVGLPVGGEVLLKGVFLIIVFIAYYSIYTANAVALIKRLNPEKHGDPLELRFQRQWMDSCDEGEKMVIYQSAYKSFRLVGTMLLALWAVAVVGSLLFDLGGFTVVVITILWLTHTVSYQYYSMKQDKKKLNE